MEIGITLEEYNNQISTLNEYISDIEDCSEKLDWAIISVSEGATASAVKNLIMNARGTANAIASMMHIMTKFMTSVGEEMAQTDADIASEIAGNY